MGSAGTHELRHPTTALNRYAADMTLGLTLLQTEVQRELPIPAWAFGVLAFGILTHLAADHLVDRQRPPAQLGHDHTATSSDRSGPAARYPAA